MIFIKIKDKHIRIFAILLIYSNGQLIFTDPTNPDSDGDGLLDGEEILINYSIKRINGIDKISSVYFKCISNPKSEDSDNDGIVDFEDILPLKPFINGKYNRDFAIYYANKYYDSYNPDYPDLDMNSGDNGGDCANFVSQCLLYSGMPMDNIWFYKDKENFSSTWSFARWNYIYFSKKYAADLIKLKTESDIYDVLKEYNIQSGDLLYFINKNNIVYHAAIVYKVESNDIIYAAHSDNKINSSLARHFNNWIDFNQNGESVAIVKLRENLYGN